MGVVRIYCIWWKQSWWSVWILFLTAFPHYKFSTLHFLHSLPFSSQSNLSSSSCVTIYPNKEVEMPDWSGIQGVRKLIQIQFYPANWTACWIAAHAEKRITLFKQGEREKTKEKDFCAMKALFIALLGLLPILYSTASSRCPRSGKLLRYFITNRLGT